MKYKYFQLPNWNKVSPFQRTNLAQKLSRNLPDFKFTDVRLC